MLYILHENDQWLAPFRETFTEMGLPFNEWHMASFLPDLTVEPPLGVFYVRMSASAHTRGHSGVPALTAGVLCLLERHGRRVLNDHRALHLEVSKFTQYRALETAGLRTPHTIASVGQKSLQQAAKSLGRTPFILKPNRGGKGLGVQLFNTIPAMLDFVKQLPLEEQPIDEIGRAHV